MKTGKRICFITQNTSRFVQDDVRILKELGYEVDFISRGKSKSRVWKHNVWEKFGFGFFFRALKSAVKSDLIYCWFAHQSGLFGTILSKILRKPCIVISGGFDVTKCPDINYGLLVRKPYWKPLVKFILKNSKVLTMAKSGIKDVKDICPEADVKELYLGVDTKVFKKIKIKKNNQILTISPIVEEDFYRKGILPFVLSIKYVVKKRPDVKFKLFGKYDNPKALNELKKIARKDGVAKNIEFEKFKFDDKKINKEYNKSAVYVQISRQEGFGLTMAEAMVCGLPIVCTKLYSIPEIVGDAGIYVGFNKPEETAKAILRLLENKKLREKLGEKAKKRILKKFTLEHREKNLNRLLKIL